MTKNKDDKDQSKKFRLKSVPTTRLVRNSVRHTLRAYMDKGISVPTSGDDEDLYAMLGVDRNATPNEIKIAFKKLALKYHPDKTKNDAVSADYFQKISKAYHILIDPCKRRIYNDYGIQGIKLMDSCGTHNEKAFKILTKKWFIGLMGVLACLTCCCFGCFCCFFCCNFCCGKYGPHNGFNSDDEDLALCIEPQPITYDTSKL